MKITLKNAMAGMLLVPVMAFGFAVTAPAVTTYASTADGCTDDVSLSNGVNCAKSEDQSADLFGSNGVFNTITNVLLFLIGAVSVIMLIIGGVRYTISGGDSAAVTSAKNTILYAIVGIVVAILAFAVVNFVIGSFAE